MVHKTTGGGGKERKYLH